MRLQLTAALAALGKGRCLTATLHTEAPLPSISSETCALVGLAHAVVPGWAEICLPQSLPSASVEAAQAGGRLSPQDKAAALLNVSLVSSISWVGDGDQG